MYKKILIPLALYHGISASALAVARALLEDGGQIVALHVHEMPDGSSGAYLDKEIVQTAYEKSRDLLKARVEGQDDVTPVMRQGHTARTIIDYATENEIDCIVIGSHKPGLADYLLGSTASRVTRHAPCAVHVLRIAG